MIIAPADVSIADHVRLTHGASNNGAQRKCCRRKPPAVMSPISGTVMSIAPMTTPVPVISSKHQAISIVPNRDHVRGSGLDLWNKRRHSTGRNDGSQGNYNC